MAGQVGIHDNGIVSANLAEQTAIACSNMKHVLSQFGADMGNIVDETFFVTDMNALMNNLEGVYGERESAYGGMPEVSQTVVQVVALVQPELQIEIKCIAHL
jgi:enamine deaminase RidA (YjgF/YER057c/UK114 family)